MTGMSRIFFHFITLSLSLIWAAKARFRCDLELRNYNQKSPLFLEFLHSCKQRNQKFANLF